MNGEQLYICPKCGEIIFEELAHIECTCDLPPEMFIKINFTSEIYNQMTKEETKQWEEMLRKRYVLCPDNQYYDKEAYYEREDENFEMELQEKKVLLAAESQSQSPKLICPKCAGTNFTPVRRKWSFITGFMTNKVDMVCNDCGHVVKK